MGISNTAGNGQWLILASGPQLSGGWLLNETIALTTSLDLQASVLALDANPDRVSWVPLTQAGLGLEFNF